MTRLVRQRDTVPTASQSQNVFCRKAAQRRQHQRFLRRQMLNDTRTTNFTTRRCTSIHRQDNRVRGEISNVEDSKGLFKPFMDLQLDGLGEDPSFKELPLPPSLSTAVGCYKKKTCTCTNRLFKSNRVRKLRTTCVEAGEDLQIYNSCLYPSIDFDLPILGVDLLHFGKKTLCIVDFQPLQKGSAYLNKYITPLSTIKTDYPYFNNTVSNRFYDDDRWFSDQMLYLNDELHLPDFYEAFKQYLAFYLHLLNEAEPIPRDQAAYVSSMHSEYDKFNKEKDPAIMMFSKMFGKEFSTAVTGSFLFSF